MKSTPPDLHDDPRLLIVARDYLAALEAGRTPNRERYLAEFPDLASVMDECLDGIELAHGAGLAFRAPAPKSEPEIINEPLGDFRIVREIGRGGMGVVYEAFQLSLGRRVALKVLPFAAGLDTKQLQRFKTEAHAAAQLHHTNIVPVYAVGSERGVHFYAMQLIDGQPLDAVIRERRGDTGEPHGETTVNMRAGITKRDHTDAASSSRGGSREHHRTVANLAEQVAAALEYAHDNGVVHRDIKPANLLLDGQGKIWITDFGLAHVSADLGQTRTGDVFGTLRYMSPEQAAGKRLMIDHRTDVYSLGATLYELLTLQPIFPGTDRQGVLHAILHDEPRTLKSIDRMIPVELETIVLKAVSKFPQDRYATAGEMAADLRRFLEDRPIAARRPSLIDRSRKWIRRHPAYFRAAILGLIFSVVVLGITTAVIAREQTRTNAAYQQEKLRAEEAEDRFQLARRSADEMIRIANEEFGDSPQMQAIRKRLLETALAFYQEFLDQRRDDPTAQAELEQTRTRVLKILSDLAVIQGAWKHVLLESPEVQDELKMDDDQRGRARTIVREIEPNGDRFGDFLKMTRDQRDGAMLDEMRRHEGEIAALLTPVQRRRFEQIALQSRGVLAFREAVVIKKLELSVDQRDRLRLLENDHSPPFAEKPRGFGGPGGFPGGGAGFPRPGPPPKGLMEKALEILTPSQMKLWTELMGTKFNGFRGGNPRPGGGGRPGGR